MTAGIVPRVRRAAPRPPSLGYLLWLRLRLKPTVWRYFAGRNLQTAWGLLGLIAVSSMAVLESVAPAAQLDLTAAHIIVRRKQLAPGQKPGFCVCL